MPIYEYQCLSAASGRSSCSAWSDPPLAACPQCGGEVKKLFSAPAVQFKGSGWYVTDYAGRGKAKGAEGQGRARPTRPTRPRGLTRPSKADKAAKGDEKPAATPEKGVSNWERDGEIQ